LKYSGGNPVSNPFINSAFDIAQRGTTFTGISTGSTYTLDRWQVYLGAGASVSVSQQATGDTTNLPQIKNCARVGRPNTNTDLTAINYGQIFENANTSRYVGQVYNISFYARAGANFSSASSALTVYVNYGTGTDQSWAGGVNNNASISQAVTLTTTWQRFTAQVSGLSGLSATLAAAATQMAVGFAYTPVGTAGAADFFELTGVQIDLGSTALPFRRNGATIQGELAACMRYFQKTYSQPTAPATAVNEGSIVGINVGTTLIGGLGRFAVVMRTLPTIVLYSVATGASGKIRSGGADINGTASDVGDGVIGYITSSGLTAGSNSIIQYTASAEL
jgi:hypothetical protein